MTSIEHGQAGPACPAWCVEHAKDIDGTVLVHMGKECGDGAEIRVRPKKLAGAAVSVGDTEGPFVDLSATTGELSPADAVRLAVSLLRAAEIAQPGASGTGLVEAMAPVGNGEAT